MGSLSIKKNFVCSELKFVSKVLKLHGCGFLTWCCQFIQDHALF